MSDHKLKCWPQYFAALLDGSKTCEIRRNDRNPPFAPGDVLYLEEWIPAVARYTGRVLRARVGHVLYSTGPVGLQDGYVALSLVQGEFYPPPFWPAPAPWYPPPPWPIPPEGMEARWNESQRQWVYHRIPDAPRS